MGGSSPQASPRFGEIRAGWAFPVLIGLSILAAASVLYLTRYTNFYYDEWDFVTAYRPGQATSILFPHNEHWSTIPILIWKLLFFLFGLRSHLPYEAAALVAHVACVLLLFALIRRRSGDLPAFAAALILLVLGSGSTDIIWAFQLGWTLSIAFGLVAMLVLETSPKALNLWRVGAVSAALLGALMSSGIGLGFVVAVGVQLLLDRDRRPYVLVIAVPIVSYLAWFLAYGGVLPGSPNPPCPTCSATVAADVRLMGAGYLLKVLVFVLFGIKASIAGVVGLTGTVSQIVPLLLVVLLAWHWFVQGRLESWELGLVAGVTAQFIVIGLARARFGVQWATDSHYVYVGVVYFLPLIANAIKRVPWRGLWRPAVSVAFGIAIAANAILLVDRALGNTEVMRTENAELRTVELLRGAPDMATSRPLDDVIMPQLTASSYFSAIDQLGSPIPSSTPDALSRLPTHAVDHEMVVLFGNALLVRFGGQQSTQGLVCQSIDSSAGSTIDLRVFDGHSIVMSVSGSGLMALSLGFLEPPTGSPLENAQVSAATLVEVQLPNTGRQVLWRLRVTTDRIGALQICGADSVQVLKRG